MNWDSVKSIVAREGGCEVTEGDGTVGQTMTIPKFMPAVQSRSRMVNLHLDQHHVGSVTHEAARYLQTATHHAPSRVSWTDATAIEGLGRSLAPQALRKIPSAPVSGTARVALTIKEEGSTHTVYSPHMPSALCAFVAGALQCSVGKSITAGGNTAVLVSASVEHDQ